MNTIIHNTKVPEMGKERKYKYNNSELVIRFGDLTEAHTDVIVCSDDNLLSAKGGTSKAIREAYGDIIIHDVNKKKNAELGDVDDSAYDKSLEYDLCNRDWMNFQEDVDYDTSAKKLYENLKFYIDREDKNK